MHLVVLVFLRRRRKQEIIKGIFRGRQENGKKPTWKSDVKSSGLYPRMYSETHQNTLSALTYMYKSKRWANASSC